MCPSRYKAVPPHSATAGTTSSGSPTLWRVVSSPKGEKHDPGDDRKVEIGVGVSREPRPLDTADV
jgi:hypothetical protein